MALHQWSNGQLQPSAVHEQWPREMFLDVVEALDEVAARPRRRTWHSHFEEWDYADYARPPGQAVYRWRVNALLARSGLTLQLAEDGPDAGLLVQTSDPARQDLLAQGLSTPVEVDRDDVGHAVELFRGRTATRADRRSAVVALAGVLERRRTQLKQVLRRRDEGALFQLANEFDLRHRDAGQQGDYDDAFLDWVFWWYLATVELTDRLLARPAALP